MELRKGKIQSGIWLLLLFMPFSVFSRDLNTDLTKAANQGETAKVNALLNEGADGNAKLDLSHLFSRRKSTWPVWRG